MAMSIRHITEKIKGEFRSESVVPVWRERLRTFLSACYLPVVVILVGISSFSLGRLSMRDDPVAISMHAGAGVSAYAGLSLENSTNESTEIPSSSHEQSEEVVASKTGTKYYLPWCSGASRIKDENLVRFATPEIARSAGYTPSATCKGIR
jgi:hypothetical protein